MSIMQMLFGKVQQAQPQNAQATPVVVPGQPDASNNPMKQGAPNVSSDPKNPTAPKADDKVTPLADFKTLWEPTPVDPNAPKPESFMPSSEDIMKAAKNVDFAKHLDTAQLAELSKGGPEAAKALVALINQAAQLTYAQSASVNTRLIEQAVEQTKKGIQTSLPQEMRKQQLNDKIFADNPQFSNPAVAPVVQALVAQVAEKFPKATQAELEQYAKTMLQGTADVLNPPKTEDSSGPNVKNDENWDNYFKGEGPAAVFQR